MTSEWLLCPECREGEFRLFVCLFIYISWRLITLQYCSGFCHTLMWISHGFTCVPHPEPLSHLPPHPIPLGHPSAPALSTCLMHPARTGNVSQLIIYMFQCYSERVSFFSFSTAFSGSLPEPSFRIHLLRLEAWIVASCVSSACG